MTVYCMSFVRVLTYDCSLPTSGTLLLQLPISKDDTPSCLFLDRFPI